MASPKKRFRVEQTSEASKTTGGINQKAVEKKNKQQTMLGSPDENVDSNWNIENYKTDYESDEHWALRRKFMETHKGKFDEDRLVCLAQAFVNIEFLGCRYPAETMKLVGELSQEVAKDFRADRASKLKRTFVTASDAAEQRAKGRSKKGGGGASSSSQSAGTQSKPNKSTVTTKTTGKANFGSDMVPKNYFGDGTKKLDLFEGLKYGKYVVMLNSGRNCLRVSSSLVNKKYDELVSEEPYEFGQSANCLIDGNIVGTGYGENLKAAKQAAHKNALVQMQTHCYSIKTNAIHETIKVEKINNEVVLNVTKETIPDNSAQDKNKVLDEGNKGYRIMRLMGWTGGGLGRQKQGREDPVGYLLKNNRLGLGSGNSLETGNFTSILKNYKSSDDIRDLQFEPTFTKEDRAKLHTIANRFGLRSNSVGVGENRRLIISKKLSNEQILNGVLLSRSPSFCDRFFIQVPESKAHLFPGHTAFLELD